MNNPSYDTLVLKDYATKLFSQAEQQATVDWELVETTIWGRKYPHKAHKDEALLHLKFAFSVGSAFRVCLTGERASLPRLLRLQLITEMADCFRKHSKWYRGFCDISVDRILSEFESRDSFSADREINCKRRFSECITYDKYGETSADVTNVLLLVGRLTVDSMSCFDEDGGFLYRKNEKCARMLASRIDQFYGKVFNVLLNRLNELKVDESYKSELSEIEENRNAKLLSTRPDGNFDLLPKAIGQELKRCNEIPGLYPKSLETVLLLVWQKYKQLEKIHYAADGNDLVVKVAYYSLSDEVIPHIRRDKMSRVLE